ncbi:hypothetical protein GGG16DRAFT_129531 [Schizophyllum commune]
MTSPHLGVRWGFSKMLNEPLLVLPEQGRSTTDTAEMDGYIASFGAHLAALKSHRNLTVSAVCMPSELLSEIFFFVAFSGRPLLRGRLQSWSYLMLVCRRWRAIGVSTPILWSRMHVGMRAHSTGQATRTLLPFASLKLAGTEPCLQHFLESYTASRRIGLQMLSLILQPAGDHGPFVLSQEATQNVVPCLLHWDALRDLQSLKMYFYSFIESDAPQPITLSVLLTVLRRSPDLRKLLLLTRNGSDMVDAQTEMVHLPCLNYLYLTAHPLLCAAMLASVHMPSWSDIVIQAPGAPENEYQPLHDAVGGLFNRPGARAMRYVRLTSSPMVLFTTDSPADEGQPDGIPGESGARLYITAYPPGDKEMQGRLLVRLLSAVPSQSITHLICGAGSLLLQRNICRLWISCRGRLDDHQIWFDALRDWAGSNADHRLRSFRWRVSKDLQDVLDACAGGGRAVRRLVISSEWQSHNMMAVITLKNLVTHAREMGVKVGMEPDTVYCEILFDTPEAE